MPQPILPLFCHPQHLITYLTHFQTILGKIIEAALVCPELVINVTSEHKDYFQWVKEFNQMEKYALKTRVKNKTKKKTGQKLAGEGEGQPAHKTDLIDPLRKKLKGSMAMYACTRVFVLFSSPSSLYLFWALLFVPFPQVSVCGKPIPLFLTTVTST